MLKKSSDSAMWMGRLQRPSTTSCIDCDKHQSPLSCCNHIFSFWPDNMRMIFTADWANDLRYFSMLSCSEYINTCFCAVDVRTLNGNDQFLVGRKITIRDFSLRLLSRSVDVNETTDVYGSGPMSMAYLEETFSSLSELKSETSHKEKW